MLVACESSPPVEPATNVPIETVAAPADVVAAERFIPAYAGAILIVPLRPADSVREYLNAEPWGITAWGVDEEPETLNAWQPVQEPTVTLGDGRRLQSDLHWLGVEEDLTDDWLGLRRTWNRHSWSAVTNDPSLARAGLGLWVAAIHLPADAYGTTARMDGRPLSLVWHEEPPEKTDTRRSPMPRLSRDQSGRLASILEPAMLDPMTAWHAALIRDRIDPWLRIGSTPPTSGGRDRILEAWALQIEHRWRTALHQLAQSDEQTAADLLNRLTAVVELPGEVREPAVLPIWPGRRGGHWELLETLLHPGLPASARVDATRDWLKRVPASAQWVIDDTGGQVPTGVTWATVATVDLTGQDGIASAAPGIGTASNSTTLPGHTSHVFRTLLPVADGELINTVRLRSRAGVRDLTTLRGHIPVTPPGLKIGPLLAGWSAPGLLANQPTPPLTGPRTFALLHRGQSDAWEIFIECERGETTGRDIDTVQLWFGPRFDSRSVISIDPGGGAVIERSGRSSSWPGVITEQKSRSWTALVPVPSDAVLSDGTLLFGMSRSDGTGLMSSWPRPLYPGQVEPGRVVIDLNYWMSLAE